MKIEKVIEITQKQIEALKIELITFVTQEYISCYKLAIEVKEIALQALQEKLEREKGCEYCNKEKNSDINVDGRRIGQAYLHECSNGYAMFLYLCGNTETYYVDAEYCPHCGRKLGENNDT